MKSEPNSWYVLYTRPGMEKKVATLLTRRKFESFVPLQKAQGQWAERRKVNTPPLFKSLVFIKVNASELPALRMVDGVINILYWLDRYATIQQEEVDTISRFIEEYNNVRLEKTAVNPSEKVRIINGPLMMWEGNVVQINTSLVKIVLPSLGYTLIGEFETNRHEVPGFETATLQVV